MTDDDDIELAIRNAPEPPARSATDWPAVRRLNRMRVSAAIRAGRTYPNGRPRFQDHEMDAAAWSRRVAVRR